MGTTSGYDTINEQCLESRFLCNQTKKTFKLAKLSKMNDKRFELQVQTWGTN